MNAAPSLPAGPPETAARDAEHLPWVDWVRFLAALAVVVNHVREFNWDWPQTLPGAPGPGLRAFLAVTMLGRPAVIVFFVLSGMLVGGKAAARVRRGTFRAGDYAADRLARIYVPLIPALLLTAAVVRGYGLPSYPQNYLVCLVGLQDIWTPKPFFNAPLWSLPYEMWFYVLTGCAAAACRRGGSWKGRLAACAGGVLAVGVLRTLYWPLLVCWLLGVAGFALRDRLRLPAGVLAAAGAAAAAGGVLVYQMNTGLLPTPGFLDARLPTPPAADLLLAVGVLVLLAGLMRLAPATRTGQRIERLGTRLAAFSYTLYLVHCPTLWFLLLPTQKYPLALSAATTARAGVWLAVCLAVAWGMYALFETRTPAARRWLAGLLGRRPGARPAPLNRPPLKGPTLAALP